MRPYSDYAVRRIADALSLRLSSLLVRRLQRGKIALVDLIVDEQRAQFAAAMAYEGPVELVIYDQDTAAAALQAPAAETAACILAASRVGRFLDGGMDAFERLHPDLVRVPEIEPRESPFLSLRALSLHDAAMPVIVADSPEPGTAVTPGQLSLQERHIHLMPPTEILPHLFIGKRQDATDKQLLLSHGITALLSVTHQPITDENIRHSFAYLSIPVRVSCCCCCCWWWWWWWWRRRRRR